VLTAGEEDGVLAAGDDVVLVADFEDGVLAAGEDDEVVTTALVVLVVRVGMEVVYLTGVVEVE
jgi:hypothetical protein